MSLTAVTDIKVGHWTHVEAATGCTAILCPPEGCVASGSVRGSAPGSRETALLEPEKSVERVHALLLSGGSAFGLAAAQGVVEWLESRDIGLQTPFARVPIVPAAVIYDLGVGDPKVRPGPAEGRHAAENASSEPVKSGRVGAGAGATCGKYAGFDKAQFSGLGNAVREVQGATLAALAVVNPVGDIVDPQTGEVVAGARGREGERLAGGLEFFAPSQQTSGTNTTLVVVATDAPLTKTQAKVLADSAHVGIVRVTRPSHTLHDGDTSFALSAGSGPEVPLMLLTVAVQETVAAAILNAVRAANAEAQKAVP